ncbi:hypothetical protein [Gracilimonas mengyeensis]|uniref:Uncharacterized protein n=1 Tax=Gracilimonas mengyeensis TaxID=1302730 RepID=A0A521DUA8_9BACT|nr:hypothetical protein [Gracilimonas mengyeensis]SMO75323.1 hypothetical protein SAMN06265219_109116 [Gracilimonas mengyeensis]
MSELNESNYRRIALINWALSVPLMVLFAWPYFYVARLLEINEFFAYFGAFIFAIPFMMTILHGHVTMALGSVHRHFYYEWMTEEKPLTYGIFFHPIFVKTRFRLILLIVSLLLLPVGYLVFI